MLSVRNADMTQQSASSNDVVEEDRAFWGPMLLHVRTLCRCSRDRDKTDLRVLCRGEYTRVSLSWQLAGWLCGIPGPNHVTLMTRGRPWRLRRLYSPCSTFVVCTVHVTFVLQERKGYSYDSPNG